MSEKMRKIEGAGKTEEATSPEAKMKYEKPAVINLSQMSRGGGVGGNPCSSGSIGGVGGDCTDGGSPANAGCNNGGNGED